jgi:Mannan-binding protein
MTKMTLIRGILAFALVGLASSGLLPVATAPVAAQPGTNTNGWNAAYVRHSGGHFARQADGSWAEYDQNGQIQFRFAEMQRDEWSVYLNDPSRNVQIQLDLFRRKITYGTGGGPRSDLYDIIGASGGATAQRPMPPVSVRMVNAGPIWNQQDAAMKCPVVAYAVNGRWTGQWRTTQQGQMSVCEIAQ